MMYTTEAQVAGPSALRMARIKLLGVRQIPGPCDVTAITVQLAEYDTTDIECIFVFFN